MKKVISLIIASIVTIVVLYGHNEEHVPVDPIKFHEIKKTKGTKNE